MFCGGDRGLWELCFATAQPPFAGQDGLEKVYTNYINSEGLYRFAHLLQLQHEGYFEGWVVSQALPGGAIWCRGG